MYVQDELALLSSVARCLDRELYACSSNNECVQCMQGNLTGAIAVLKGTPTTYNKDNQEVWELLFSTLDTMNDTVGIATGVLSTLTINPDRMRSGLSADMLATDLAEYLVRKVRIRLQELPLDVFGVSERPCHSKRDAQVTSLRSLAVRTPCTGDSASREGRLLSSSLPEPTGDEVLRRAGCAVPRNASSFWLGCQDGRRSGLSAVRFDP
jgi:hypothetical protein